MKTKKNRIWELDFLRGFAIILVVFDHAFYDFGFLFNDWLTCGVPILEKICAFSQGYIDGDVRFLWRPAFLFLFFCVSGICTAVSRNNFFRGLRLWAVAAAVSLVTFLVDLFSVGNTFVLFGVLHCLAAITILFSAVEFAIKGTFFIVEKAKKRPVKDGDKRWTAFTVYLAVAAATLAINFRYNVTLASVASGETVTEGISGRVAGLFFFTSDWWTADYFPLFPYISFFFFGAALGKLAYENKKTLLPKLDGVWHTPITFAGKYSLFVYLGGQILSVAIGALLTYALLGESIFG